MEVLTYGLKKPETGDKGSTFFPALEDDITQLDAHNHNGVNSAKLSTSSLVNSTQAILAAGWIALGDGTGRYYQNVTMAGGLAYDGQLIAFRKTDGNKDYLCLDVEKVSANTYKVYCNDNTLNVTALYT